MQTEEARAPGNISPENYLAAVAAAAEFHVADCQEERWLCLSNGIDTLICEIH